MLKNLLKITFRNMMKNKVFVIINILGLGTALACCIVAYLNWEYNDQFDDYHLKADQHVYRVNFSRITNGRPINNGNCPLPLGEQMGISIPQVKEVIRYYPIGGNFRVNNEVFTASIAAVDPSFFNVFHFPMEAGKAFGPEDKQSIVISAELQGKHFPNQANPIGETLTYINGEKRIEFRVEGVFQDPPKNTSFSSDAFILYEHTYDMTGLQADNWAFFNSTFVSIDDPGNKAAVESQLEAYVEIQNTAKQDYKVNRYYLDPFEGMAVRAERENTWNHWFRQSLPSAAATAPGIMAFLILLIACFNFTNTSIAIANRRIKEIGIRKVLGSNRKQLIFQFLGENVLLVMLSLVISLVMAAYLVPAYSAMWPFLEIELNLVENWTLIGFLFVLLLFTALAACCYPAVFVSNFQPDTIFRGTTKFSGTNKLTRVLLTLQYSISLLAIISGFVFSQNAIYQENYDMGFDMKSIVFANVKNGQGFTKMRNELLGNPKIIEMAGSRHSMSTSWYTDPIKHGASELDVNIFDVGPGYLSAIDATLVSGRDFKPNSQTDIESAVIINQQLAQTMGWEDPIDQRIVLRDTIALIVVGVVKDIYFEGGLWDPLEPMILRCADESRYRYLTVRADKADLLAIKSTMDKKWGLVFPDELSSVAFMDLERSNSLLVNNNIKVLFIFLGIVAALLSVIGLFSLLSLNLIKRMKEIGIRKVFGASVSNISLKVSKEFIIVLGIASIIGCIGGYFLSDLLMGNIWAYHVPLQVLPFVLSVLLLFLASGLTIGGKVLKAASTNIAEVLRDQ